MSAATSSSSGSAPSLDALLVDRIPHVLPDSPRVAAVTPVAAPGGLHPNVRRVTLADGRRLVAKRHTFAPLAAGKPYDLLTVERTVTDLLLAHDGRVPRVLGTLPESGIVLLEDVGAETLDDFVQTAPPVKRAARALDAFDAFLRIQKTFVDHPPAQSLVAPGGDTDTVRDTFRTLGEEMLNAQELGALLPARDADRAADVIGELIGVLADSGTVLGSTDYNARNVIVAGNGVFYVEWSKIGYDWPERRIVQYLTSLGSGRKGSRPRCLVDARLVERYAAVATGSTSAWEAAAVLDAHHLIFHLLLALRCVRGGVGLTDGIRTSLSTPLSGDAASGGVRELFRAS